jgi:hypothetical protein
MQVIDSDGHLHEPFDLFERHIEKEFYPISLLNMRARRYTISDVYLLVQRCLCRFVNGEIASRFVCPLR